MLEQPQPEVEYELRQPPLAREVEAWRLHVLLEVGYPTVDAELLAAARHVDLHLAVDLIASGCPPHLALLILV